MNLSMKSLIAAALVLAPCASFAQQAAPEGRLAQLYAARPPAGSAFVRVLNPGSAALKVAVGPGAEQSIGPATRASRYAIVEGGKPFTVRVAGKPRSQPQVAAGSFTTLVLDAPPETLRSWDWPLGHATLWPARPGGPSPVMIENAIQRVEDQIEPVARHMPAGARLVASAATLARQLGTEDQAIGAPLEGQLQLPVGPAQALQSGVLALVLQGADAAAPRTSALLVLDFQPQLAATVYGRDMLQQATGRLDPWTQMAVLQASGQVPREEDRARNGASGLCETVGCPYAARAACVQPFCLAMRGVREPGLAKETLGRLLTAAIARVLGE